VDWLSEHFPDPEDQREYARQKCVEAIGSALERAMEAANLNRVALATKLGKSKSQVSRILSGAHNMTLYTLGELLWACNVEVDDLVLAPLGVVSVSTNDQSLWSRVSQAETEPSVPLAANRVF
jgi:transcriptional regulator with XRE-family HTH domain